MMIRHGELSVDPSINQWGCYYVCILCAYNIFILFKTELRLLT